MRKMFLEKMLLALISDDGGEKFSEVYLHFRSVRLTQLYFQFGL